MKSYAARFAFMLPQILASQKERSGYPERSFVLNYFMILGKVSTFAALVHSVIAAS